MSSAPHEFAVTQIRPGDLPAAWPLIQTIVEKGLRRGMRGALTASQLCLGVLKGDLLLWAVTDAQGAVIAIVALRLTERASGRALIVLLAAGREFSRWGAQVSELISDYAKLAGATAVEAEARPGMARWLEALGWRRKAIVMELPNG